MPAKLPAPRDTLAPPWTHQSRGVLSRSPLWSAPTRWLSPWAGETTNGEKTDGEITSGGSKTRRCFFMLRQGFSTKIKKNKENNDGRKYSDAKQNGQSPLYLYASSTDIVEEKKRIRKGKKYRRKRKKDEARFLLIFRLAMTKSKSKPQASGMANPVMARVLPNPYYFVFVILSVSTTYTGNSLRPQLCPWVQVCGKSLGRSLGNKLD